MPVEDPLEDLLLPAGALPARRTLAAGFPGEELDEPQACFHRVGGLVHDDDGTRSEHRTGFANYLTLQRQVEVLLEEPGGRCAAGDERLQLVAVPYPPTEVVAVEELPEGGDPVLDLVDPGSPHVAGHCEQSGAR